MRHKHHPFSKTIKAVQPVGFPFPATPPITWKIQSDGSKDSKNFVVASSIFYFTPKIGEIIYPIRLIFFQMGNFNHQLEKHFFPQISSEICEAFLDFLSLLLQARTVGIFHRRLCQCSGVKLKIRCDLCCFCLFFLSMSTGSIGAWHFFYGGVGEWSNYTMTTEQDFKMKLQMIGCILEASF